jgi:fructose PTS system EIIBC or EIIC component
MKVSDILHIDSIDLNLVFSDKNELINKLVDLACKSTNVFNKEEIKREIIKREKLQSSVIKGIIAIPHAKSKSVKNTTAAFAVVKYRGNSGEFSKLKLAVLIIGNENNTGNYLRTISKLCRMLNEKHFLDTLIKIKNKEAILKIFQDSENTDE